MTQYTLLNPHTGVSKTLPKIRLTRSLELNAILLEDGEHVGIVTHYDLVSFNRWYAGLVLSRHQTVPPEAHAALELVDKWLVDPKSVSSEQLTQAADVVDIAEVAWAVWAARSAADAAWAARTAGYAAADAAWAAWVAVDADAEDAALVAAVGPAVASCKEQAQWLVDHLRSAQ